MGRPNRSGPVLPYRTLAGVVPHPKGWQLISGKLQGTTLLPDGTDVVGSILDVLDYRPGFEVIALHSPIGLPGPGSRGRRCELEARSLLGWPRGAAVTAAPNRAAVAAPTYEAARELNDGKLSVVEWVRFPHVAEVIRDVGSYHQRTVFEIHPELSFHQLNDDVPLLHSKHDVSGINERRDLLERRLPGIERMLENPPNRRALSRLLDASVALWTARRIAARAIIRLPEDPEWDDEGLRMELVR